MRPLDLGGLTGPHGFWEAGAPSEPYRIPVTGWLISHPRGTIVFDCGMHTDLSGGSAKLEALSMFLGIDADEDAMIASRLRALDTDPADVDAVVASHLHWDHIGGLAQLPNARLVVQRAEWEAANDPDVAAVAPYEMDEYQTGHDIEFADGGHDVFGDGSVTCIPTPGHTAGHQSLLLQGENGRFILCGDCCFFERTVDGAPLPPFGHDLERQADSVALIREIRDRGAQVVPAHDPDFWSRHRSGS